VVVNTIPIPATIANQWTRHTINYGSALSSGIKSIALYSGSSTPSASLNILFDQIITCKNPASVDSLSLNSFIGKAPRAIWAANTAYTLGQTVRATPANGNILWFQCTKAGTSGASEPTWPDDTNLTVADNTAVWTSEGFDEYFWPIQNISGTTVTISTARGYYGTTGSFEVYKKEAWVVASVMTTWSTPALDGAVGSPVTYQGGVDPTTNNISGDTMIDGKIQYTAVAYFINAGARKFNTFNNFVGARYLIGFYYAGLITDYGVMVRNFKAIQNYYYSFEASGAMCTFTHCLGIAGAPYASIPDFYFNSLSSTYKAIASISSTSNTTYGALFFSITSSVWSIDNKCYNLYSVNGAGYGLSLKGENNWIYHYQSADNNTASINGWYNGNQLINPSIGEGTPTAGSLSYTNDYLYIQNLNGSLYNDYWYSDGYVANRQNSVSYSGGYCWQLSPTSAPRTSSYPAQFLVGSISCTANHHVTVTCKNRRTNAGITAQLKVYAFTIGGVTSDVTVPASQPTYSYSATDLVNGWETLTLTFTPTESRTVPLYMETYGGTTYSAYIDDVTGTLGAVEYASASVY
jgi:hypothetical protein